MLKKKIKSVFNSFGYDIIRLQTDVNIESEFYEYLNIVRSNTMVVESGLYSLYRQALFCETSNVVGDYVECGVWKGGAVGLMALVNMNHGGYRRQLHLFDSFEDICTPDEKIDGARAINEAKSWYSEGGTNKHDVAMKGFYDKFGGHGTIKENEDLILQRIAYDKDNVHFHKGWFQDTLPQCHNLISKIAILRIDADWYASTKVCLDHLFNKVVIGGFVIIDDYGAYDGCRKAVDEYVKSTGKLLFLNRVNSEIRYIIIS